VIYAASKIVTSLLARSNLELRHQSEAEHLMSDTAEDNKDSSETTKPSLYTLQNLWYFKDQSGEEVGPFRYRSEEESNLEKFLTQLEDQLNSKP